MKLNVSSKNDANYSLIIHSLNTFRTLENG